MTNQEAINVLFNEWKCIDRNDGIHCDRKCESCDLVMDVGIIREAYNMAISALEKQIQIGELPSAQPENNKYEYHYDHTDCIWYRPEARNRCPVTCAQYRDGWNDAMNYIFRDGKGYRPYRRDEQYGQ